MTNPFYHSSTPLVSGSLHSLSNEHDNCGMGAIAHLEGKRSFTVVDHALTSVSCMTFTNTPLRVDTVAREVPFGTRTAYHWLASNPGRPDSATVGN